jgi:hypothetical protein
MDSIINQFKGKYPSISNRVEEKWGKYPAHLKMRMVLNVSVMMAMLSRGDFNEYLRDGCKITDELMDCIGKCYLQNFEKLADSCYMMTGSYEHLPKLNTLNPKTFPITLINKCCD